MRKLYFTFLANLAAAILLIPLIGQAAGLFYTQENLPSKPTLNQVVDNPLVGDERSFMAVVDLKTGIAYTDEVPLKPGRTYVVNIIVANDAPGTVAKDVTLSLGLVDNLYRDERSGAVYASLRASNITNANQHLFKAIFMQAERPVTIQRVADSLEYCTSGDGPLDWIDEDALFGGGALLGYDALDGNLPGGAKYTAQVIYRFYVAPKLDAAPTRPWGAAPIELAKNQQLICGR